MGDRKLTLLELHLNGDTQFGPTIGSIGSDEEEEETEVSSEDESSLDVGVDAGPNPLRGVLGLVAIFLVVVAVKRLLGGDVESDLGE